MNFTKTHENIIIILVIIASFIFWNSLVLFPVKLIAVVFHEMTHVITALITGGIVEAVTITTDLGGVTTLRNANEIPVLAAGYPGSLILGIILYLSLKKEKLTPFILGFISLLYILFPIFFIKNQFGIFSSLGIALFFGALIFLKQKSILSITLKVLSLLSISYVINDVIYDTFLTSSLYSDAVRLEQLTGINDYLWGSLWILLAVTALTIIIWNMFRLRKK